MCKPYRSIHPLCRHPLARGWHHWAVEPCRVALFTGRECWIPVDLPLAMIEDRVWGGGEDDDDGGGGGSGKLCKWCAKKGKDDDAHEVTKSAKKTSSAS
ncbi:hypothetical protein JDV02_005523 [Purpureocillium takamizusanense]|uniref:Uncharacterized protein n=1 Tax=Purpureocillium takamizusanense TaxID=2060973 RepID=A0A9Q8QGN6_9HYPO|nr:uncharacterized protein JDV02_005523 [Purpureocillium takamizusanense]UNI19333.1 hypothetical protein JDV02_005523 [Purpureocillium takamizusanense]